MSRKRNVSEMLKEGNVIDLTKGELSDELCAILALDSQEAEPTQEVKPTQEAELVKKAVPAQEDDSSSSDSSGDESSDSDDDEDSGDEPTQKQEEEEEDDEEQPASSNGSTDGIKPSGTVAKKSEPPTKRQVTASSDLACKSTSSSSKFALLGVDDSQKARLINAFIGRDLFPVENPPNCNISVCYENRDDIILTEYSDITKCDFETVHFSEIYKATGQSIRNALFLIITVQIT